MSDTSRSECSEKGRGSHIGQKKMEKLKGKVPRVCVTPACLYGLETVALTEQQQQKLQVCKNNWVRRKTTTTKVDRRKMTDLRKEVGMQCSLTGRLVRSRMSWVVHLVRMDADKLAKRAEVEKLQGRRKKGRPQLRWEDCARRDMRRSGEDEGWRELAADRKLWKERSERVARQYFTRPSPMYGREQGGRASTIKCGTPQAYMFLSYGRSLVPLLGS